MKKNECGPQFKFNLNWEDYLLMNKDIEMRGEKSKMLKEEVIFEEVWRQGGE